ncbi:MAG: TonB-dependent receptor [Flavobacteriales bacterium]|nr:TonB-dependent receptor [Flavobacteriales bacterium]
MKTLLQSINTRRELSILVAILLQSSISYSQHLTKSDSIDLNMKEFNLEEVVITATRAGEKTPMSYSNLDKEELEKRNLGQDLPSLMNYMPSVVTTTDAGAGVGYSGIRVRGSDAQRVNVTINGVPLNDSESSGVYWVNMPDLSSSVEDVQLQRGVGTSTNGAASFGASLNIRTSDLSKDPHAQLNTSAGSFDTKKISAIFSTGEFAEKWEFNGRFSKITSDGYIDRAASDLSSYYFSGSYSANNTFIKAVAFGGTQTTYQAWNGSTLDEQERYGRTFNSAGAIYDDNWNVIDYYKNETDNYKQDNYQLHITQKFNDNISTTLTFHYTKGFGFYENYKQDADMVDYNMPPVNIGGETITTTDLVRRKYMNNDFYGIIANVNFTYNDWHITLGGAGNTYQGGHYGEVLWAEYTPNLMPDHEFYNNDGDKIDANLFAKANYQASNNLNLFVDLQGRFINYKMYGTYSPTDSYDVDDEFVFFNPKAGFTYSLNDNSLIYASYAVANKEPNRVDYQASTENGSDLPKAETLQDIEIGYKLSGGVLTFNSNYYMMYYTNQLVLTGEMDQVGRPIRENSGKSYRTGIELEVAYSPTNWFSWRPNASFAINKNIDFNTKDDSEQIIEHGDTEISYSPSIVASNVFIFRPSKGLYLSLLSKYVGEQYMTNFELEESKLEAYFTTDINAVYEVPKIAKTVDFELSLLLNNILNSEYTSNGYMWGTTPYYYPQAKFNFLVGLNIKI